MWRRLYDFRVVLSSETSESSCLLGFDLFAGFLGMMCLLLPWRCRVLLLMTGLSGSSSSLDSTLCFCVRNLVVGFTPLVTADSLRCQMDFLPSSSTPGIFEPLMNAYRLLVIEVELRVRFFSTYIVQGQVVSDTTLPAFLLCSHSVLGNPLVDVLQG